MTKVLFTILPVLILSLAIISCDRQECNNTNPTFEKYAPETKEYKDELVRQFAKADKSKLRYWVDTYQEEDNARYLYVHVQDDALCAKLVLSIKDSNEGICRLLKNKGMSYKGAELENLKFDIRQDSTQTEFVFREVSGIVD